MKTVKVLSIIIVAVIGMILFTGCSSRKDNLNSMDMSEVNRLPEVQKDSELDKALAEMRKYRTDNVKVGAGGVSTSLSMRDDAIPGQTKKRPEFTDLTTDEFWEFIYEYLEDEVKVLRRKYGYDVAQCIDPRMNTIYDEDDKGLAAGYENEDILLIEYETSEDNIYSYLVLVRESKENPWKVIHDGLSYKE